MENGSRPETKMADLTFGVSSTKNLFDSIKVNPDKILSVRFSADSRLLVSAGLYQHTLWSLARWNLHGKIIGEGIGIDVDFSPNSKMYATPDLRGVILRSTTNGARIVSLKGGTGSIKSINFSPDGNTLVGGDKKRHAQCVGYFRAAISKN